MKFFKSLVFLLISANLAWASQETPQTFTLDGRLYSDASGTTPLSDSLVTLTIQVLDKNQSCILYEEVQTANTQSSNGYFSVQVGSSTGALKRTTVDSGNSMAVVFANSGASILGKQLSDLTTVCFYTPAAGEARYVRVQVKPSSDNVTRVLTPYMAMTSIPSAVVAERAENLQGLTKNNFLQVNTTAPNSLNQTNLESIFTTTNFSRLTTLLSVPASNYVQTGSNGAATVPSVSGDPSSGLTAGQIWYDSVSNTLKYYDGSVKTLGSGGGSGVTSISAGTGLLGGPVTSTGTLSVDVGTTVGKIVQVQTGGKLPALDGSNLTGLTASQISAGTLSVNRGGTGNGSFAAHSVIVSDLAGSQLQSLNCSNGQVLKFDVSGYAVCGADNGASGNEILKNGNSFGSAFDIGSNDNYGLGFKTNNTVRMVIDTSGQIGIGTTSPGAGVDIVDRMVGMRSGTMQPRLEIFSQNENTNGSGVLAFTAARSNATASPLANEPLGQITFGNANGAGADILGIAAENMSSSALGSFLAFRTVPNGTTALTERMRIDQNGNVGIGTTAPGNKLSVAGIIESTTGGIRFPDGTVQTTATGGGSGGTMVSSLPDAIYCVNGSNRMYLYLSYATPNIEYKHISDTSSFTLEFTPAGAYVGNVNLNGYDCADNNWSISQVYSNGRGFNFVGGGSNIWTASAGNTYFSGGNVGIGTASPGAKLDVYENSNSTVGSKVSTQTLLDIMPTSNGAGEFWATKATAAYSSANNSTGGVRGAEFVATNNGAGTLAASYGAVGATTNNSIGTINSASGLYGSVANTSTGTIVSGSGGSFSVSSPAGEITFGVGVNIGTIQAANKWSIYSSDATAPSYFAGAVGIGVLSPNTTLDVNGAVSARGVVAPALSPAGQGRIYFDSTAKKFKVSEDNGAYVDLVGASGGGSYLSASGGTLSGALTVSSGGISNTGGLNNNSGTITNAGTISGVTSVTGTGAMTVASGGTNSDISLTPAGTGQVKVLGMEYINGLASTSSDAFLNINGGLNNTGITSGVALNPYINGTTAATTFYGFTSAAPTVGAGSLTNYSVLHAVDATARAGYTRGIDLDINSGANRHNIYVSGTADNYFAGKIGIGTATPGTLLDINGTATPLSDPVGMMAVTSTDAYAVDKGGTVSLGGKIDGTSVLKIFGTIGGFKENSTSGNEAGYLVFATRANGGVPAERMRIDSAGNVGIGTTSPSNTLSIYGTSNYGVMNIQSSGITAESSIGFRLGGESLSSTNWIIGKNVNGSTTGAFGIWNANTTRMTIDTAGNVGIGTTDPQSALHVNGNITTNGGFQFNTYEPSWTGYETNPYLKKGWTAPTGDYLYLGATGSSSNVWQSSLLLGKDTGFQIGLGSASGDSLSATWLTVNRSGNVGIGTTSPRAALDVSGAIVSKASVANASSTIDFSGGNIQHTTADCGSYTLKNLKDGGSYIFIVKGTNVATCSFTAFSDSGSTSLTVHLPPGHGATTNGKQTLYNLAVSGGDVYLAWTPGY